MVVLLVLATAVDVGLAVLLVAVSGFMLEGVNGTGPLMPDAVFYVLFIALAAAAPVGAWTLRSRGRGARVPIVVALVPIVIAALAVLLEPMLT